MPHPPTRWWHVLSALLFLVGAVAVPIVLVFSIVLDFSSGDEFFIPGTHVLNLDKPGGYVVWNTTSQFRDGRQYQFPDNLPDGMHIRILNDATGKEIPAAAAMKSTETTGNTSRSAVCNFTIPAPGSYSVIVDGTPEQRLLMVRPSLLWPVLCKIALCIVIPVIALALALAISITVELRHYRTKKQLPNIPPN